MQVLPMSQLNLFILLAHSSNLSDAKKSKCHTLGKKKSLFPACVFLHFLMNEQNRELISSTDMSVGKSRAVPAILNARVKKCNMIFGQYGIK